MIQPMERQWEAADRFKALGAEIETSPSKIPWLIKQFLPDDRNSDITTIKVPSFAGECSEAMKGLRHLPHVERLYLTRQEIEDDDVAALSKLTKLRRLALWGNRLTDESAEQLASIPNLEVIDLKKNDFSWRALLAFEDRPDIEVRHDFAFESAKSEELEAMARLNNQSEKLTLEDYSPGMVAKAFQWFPNLKEFTHRDWTEFGKDDFQALIEASDRKLQFSLEGKPPLDSPGWLAAAKVLRPQRIRISGSRIPGYEQEHSVYISIGNSTWTLSAFGDFSDSEVTDFFSSATRLNLYEVASKIWTF